MLTIEKISKFDDFLQLKHEWNVLLDLSEVDHPFLTHVWISSWWQSFGQGSEMIILLIKDNGATVAIAPFMKKKMSWRGIPVNAITFIANSHSFRSGLIVKEGYEEKASTQIAYYLKSTEHKIDIFYFELIQGNTVMDLWIEKSLKGQQFLFRKMIGAQSPFLLINESWEEYLKTRPKKLKRNIKNILEKAKKNGYEIKSYDTLDINKAIIDVLHITKKSWKFKQHTAIASDASVSRFYKLLAEKTAQKKWLEISILMMENTPVAFEFKLNYRERAYFLKTGFDEKYKKYSPGFVILVNSLKRSFKRQFKLFDFLGGKDEYKMRWTELDLEYHKYVVFNKTLKAFLLSIFELRLIPTLKNNKFWKNHQKC